MFQLLSLLTILRQDMPLTLITAVSPAPHMVQRPPDCILEKPARESSMLAMMRPMQCLKA